MEQDWYMMENVSEMDTPFLAVFPDRIRKNIQALMNIIPDTARIRPHVKTNKSKHAVKLLMEEGIYKFKCATIAEAAMLAEVGVLDVLLAYQPIGPKVERLLNLISRFRTTTFSCLVDNMETAKEMAKVALRYNFRIPVWLDLNVGMNRTGIDPEFAFELYQFIQATNGIVFAGIHAYDGHITNRDLGIRRKEYLEVFKKLESLTERIIEKGYPLPAINTGSTPTLKLHAPDGKTEISPGTFIYWDQSYQDLYSELPFIIAMVVVSRVISKPFKNSLCLDLGYKSLSSESIPQQRIHLLDIPDAEIIGESEEHLLVKTPASEMINTGDIVYGIPYHIGRTANLYPSALVVYNHLITGEWLHSRER
jgi:D-threonine aldolase